MSAATFMLALAMLMIPAAAGGAFLLGLARPCPEWMKSARERAREMEREEMEDPP